MCLGIYGNAYLKLIATFNEGVELCFVMESSLKHFCFEVFYFLLCSLFDEFFLFEHYESTYNTLL